MFKRIKILRKQNNLTQKNIAEILNISQSRYSLYENGKIEVPVYILSKLANFYKTSIDYIVEDTNIIEKY